MADPTPKKRLPGAGGFGANTGLLGGGAAVSKYDKNTSIGNINNLATIRSESQGVLDEAGNSLMQMLTTVGGQAIQSVGALADPAIGWLNGSRVELDEGLTNVGGNVVEYGTREFPIWQDPYNTKISEYLFSHLPSVASSASMLIPGMGVARGVGLVGRAARLGKLGTGLLEAGIGSWAMREAENRMEAAQVYNQILNDVAMGKDANYAGVTEEEARKAAQVGADTVYAGNRLNYLFDFLQMAAVLRPLKGLAGWGSVVGKNSKFGQVMDYGYKTALEKGVLEGTGKLATAALRAANLTRPVLFQTTEGVEEIINGIAQKEGVRAAEIEAGIRPDDGTDYMQRVKGYMGEAETWDNFAWGVIGGVAFQKGGEYLTRLGAKKGWWDDTTSRGQMLASLKSRADIIQQGYKDLQDPSLTESDKELVKGNMLFKLVEANRANDTMDMLLEDLQNPKLTKKFAEMMGMSEEDAKKQIPHLVEDMQYISDRIDQYTGDSLRSYLGSNAPDKFKAGLNEEEETTQNSTVAPTVLSRLFGKKPFASEAIGLQLAFNDYSIRVQDRINQKVEQESLQNLQQTFAGLQLDSNAQMVFKLRSELMALRNLKAQEEGKLKNEKEVKRPERFVKDAEDRVKSVNDTIAKKEKELADVKELMKQAEASGMTGTTVKEAEEFADKTLAANSRHPYLSFVRFNNMVTKQARNQMNKRLLEDPDGYLKDSIEGDNAVSAYRKMKEEEEKRLQAERDEIKKAIKDLESENDKDFAAKLKREEEGLESALSQFTSDDDKKAFLNKELNALSAEFDKHSAAGKFQSDNKENFDKNFDKDLWRSIKAKEAAIRKRLAAYGGNATRTSTSTSKKAKAKPPILTLDFEPGTPGYLYQKLVRAFGVDGRGGYFTNTVMNNSDTGITVQLNRLKDYPDRIKQLSDIMAAYDKALQDKDPNAADIIKQGYDMVQGMVDEIGVVGTKPAETVGAAIDTMQEMLHKSETRLGLSETSAIDAPMLKPLKAQGAYAEMMKVLTDALAPYKNLVEMSQNMPAVYGVIEKALEDARIAYENTLPPTQGGKQELDLLDLEILGDQKPKDQNAPSKKSGNDVAVSRNGYVASSPIAVTEFTIVDGDISNTYAHNKQLPNSKLTTGNAIYIGKGGKTLPGYVEPGDELTVEFVEERKGEKIFILFKNGIYVGRIEPARKVADRIKKNQAKLKSGNIAKQQKEKIERDIARDEALLKQYADLDKKLGKVGDTVKARVVQNINTAVSGSHTGGVGIGDIIQTVYDPKLKTHVPIALGDAFPLGDINRTQDEVDAPVYMTVFYEDRFLVYDPADGKAKSIMEVRDNIAIPRGANEQAAANGGSLNGSIWALVPTNTKNVVDGKRMYMPIKLHTAQVNKSNLTSDGTPNGKTLPEVILDVLMNPDARWSEFQMLAARAGVPMKGNSVNDPQNKQALQILFTTEKLLSLFNDVTYVYDSENRRWKTDLDLSWHIGMQVYTPKDGGLPVLKFDLSNSTDPAQKNQYVIKLFNDEGKFAPEFGHTKRTGAQTSTAAGVKETPALARIEHVVDVREEINQRLRQKLFRVRMDLLHRNSSSAKYKGLSLKGDRLVETEHGSYLDYLHQNRILDATVHGVPLAAESNGSVVTGRTYFNFQTFWLDFSDAPAQPKGDNKNKGKAKTGRTSTTKGKKTTTTKKKKTTSSSVVIVPAAIKTSQDMDKAGKIKRPVPGSQDYYLIDGVPYPRVSSTLPKKNYKGTDELPTAVGNLVDTFAKDFFDGKQPVQPEGMTDKVYNDLLSHLEGLRRNLESRGETVIGTSIVVWGEIMGADGKMHRVAGEIDLATVDKQGNIHLYDLKSSSETFNHENYHAVKPGDPVSTADIHQEQLTKYSHLVEHMGGEPVKSIGVMGITVQRGGSKAKPRIDGFIGYDIIDFEEFSDYDSRDDDGDTDFGNDGSQAGVPLDDDDAGSFIDDDDDSGPTQPNIAMDTFSIERSEAIRTMNGEKTWLDPSRFVDQTRDYFEQSAFEEYTMQLVLDAAYDEAMKKGIDRDHSYGNLLKGVKEILQRKIKASNNILDNKGKLTKDNYVRYSDAKLASVAANRDKMQELMKYLDNREMSDTHRTLSNDFVGYVRVAAMRLMQQGVLDMRIDIDQIIQDEADGTDTKHWQEKFAFKIDPKTSVTLQAKIFLSRIPELTRVTTDEGYSFKPVANVFGQQRYYKLDPILNEMHMEFENVPHDKFMKHLETLDSRIPFIRSTVNTIRAIGKDNPAKAKQLYNQLATLIKQRRDMKVIKVSTEDGKVSAKPIDAARQGIVKNILNEWENNFRKEFHNFFDIKQGEGGMEATAKAQRFTYVEKKHDSALFDLSLPSDYDGFIHRTTWQREWLFKEMQRLSQSTGNMRVYFEFDGDHLVVGGQTTDLSKEDVAHLYMMFNMPSGVSIDKRNEDLFSKSLSYVKENYLEQVRENIAWALSKKGTFVGTEGKKDSEDYDPVYYRMVAHQMERIGIQLAEDKNMSWTVLQDLNKPTQKNRRVFHRYDRLLGADFAKFIDDKVGNLVIGPLLRPKALGLANTASVDVEEDVQNISLETPFAKALQGLDPLAKHARMEWHSYANETIRNINGDMEYTYNPASALSIMMSRVHDGEMEYLNAIAQTAQGRYNPFIQKMLKSEEYRNSFTLHYVDGAVVDKFEKIAPEGIGAGGAALISWAMYYNGERKQPGNNSVTSRNQGGYISTHSDSSIMPVFMFEKQVIGLDFVEQIDEATGERTYRVRVPRERDGEPNRIWNNLYNVFTGEVVRIKETYDAWADIMAQPKEEQLQYALNNYQQHLHFRIARDGSLKIGNGINLYMFGNRLFDGEIGAELGLYANADKTRLGVGLFREDGTVNEARMMEVFERVNDIHINDMIESAYQNILAAGDAFFTMSDKSFHSGNKEDTKSLKERIAFKYLDDDAVSLMRSLFKQNAHLYEIVPEGEDMAGMEFRTDVMMRDLPIEKKYIREKLIKEGMSEKEADDFLAQKDKERAEDRKKATFNQMLLKYMVADKVINYHFFYSTFYNLLKDPAVLKTADNYDAFRDEFEKRMKGDVSPGNLMAHESHERVHVIPIKDVRNAEMYTSIPAEALAALDSHEQEFLEQFLDRFGFTRDKVPARWRDYVAFVYSKPPQEREQAWNEVGQVMRSAITDGGSYVSPAEWLYRLYRQGNITAPEYWDYLDYFQNGLKGKRPMPFKLMKYVYGGNNVTETPIDTASNIYTYMKHAEVLLAPGLHPGTELDKVARKLIERERQIFQNSQRGGEPRPGVILAPESTLKTGFTSNAALFDENGVATDDILSVKEIVLSRGFLREQVESPDNKASQAILSTQANVLNHLNIPSNWRFGRRGPHIFTSQLEGEGEVYEDIDGEEVRDDSGNGLSNHAIELSKYRIFTELAERRTMEVLDEMGLEAERIDDEESGRQYEYTVESIRDFIANMKHNAYERGVGMNAVDYLEMLNDFELKIPVTFSPAARRLQSVVLSQLRDMFYRFTLPGGAFAQFSGAGMHATDKSGVKTDSALKSYRVKVETSRVFPDLAAALREFNHEELVKDAEGNVAVTKVGKGVTVQYQSYDAAEAIIPWIFKDANGKPLPYDKYVNPDGTIKEGMIDPALLDIIALRIPNTGNNASAKLRVVKFLRPELKDGIVVPPEVISILGADFDYDKLFTYIYNYQVGKDGKLQKVESILHKTQKNAENFFLSDTPKRAFAQRRLQFDRAYKKLHKDLRDLENEESPETAADVLVTTLKATKSVKLEDLQKMTADAVNNQQEAKRIELERQIIEMENKEMDSKEFRDAYGNATEYQKQTTAALENALIDSFHLILGDFKTLKGMTSLLTSDWLKNQVIGSNARKVTYTDANGQLQRKTIAELLHSKPFHSITSFDSFLQSRLGNSSAGKMIGIMANGQVSLYQGQRFNFAINAKAYPPELMEGYLIRFADKDGKVKEENLGADYKDDSTVPTRAFPYKTRTVRRGSAGTVIYDVPPQGRFRLDRFYVINDKGEKVYISQTIQAALQASLDHQKDPIIDKAFLNPETANAFLALVRLGYVDEAIPLINQEGVHEFVRRSSNYYAVGNGEFRTEVLIDIVSRYAGQYGVSESYVRNVFDGLPDKHKNGAQLITEILKEIREAQDYPELRTDVMLSDIAIRAGEVQADQHYGLRQLQALRTFIAADKVGRQMHDIQQATNAYSKGLRASFAEVDLQERRMNDLFRLKWNRTDNRHEVESSVPMISGVQRIRKDWSMKVSRKHQWRPSMMGYAYYHGLVPTLSILRNTQGNVFSEMTPLFANARKRYFEMAIGKNIDRSIEGIASSEYTRVFNKVNVNLVSFIFSNPELYYGLFENKEEYKAFADRGLEMLTRPANELPYNESFTLFNNKSSLSIELAVLAEKVNPVTGRTYGQDYDILTALKPLFQISEKTPSSVVYQTANAYQQDINHKLALSIADMYRNSDAEVRNIIKKLILYGFMTGGIVTPTSFIQFLPPHILRDFGFDRILRRVLKIYEGGANMHNLVQSFMVQYFQHNPFEMKATVKAEHAVIVDNDIVQQGKDGVDFIQISPLYRNEYAGRVLIRYAHRIYRRENKNSLKFIRIDNAGMNRWHRNEYSFNTLGQPARSLYLHNKANEKDLPMEGLELLGDMDSGESDEDPYLADIKRRAARDFMEKLDEYVAAGSVRLDKLIWDMQVDKTNPTALGVLTYMQGLMTRMKPAVQFVNDGSIPESVLAQPGFDSTGQPFIRVNMKHKDMQKVNFEKETFFEAMAHEATHLATMQVIHDVLTGTETDPQKVALVKRLAELRLKAMEAMEKDPELAKEHQTLTRFMKVMDKVAAGGKLSPAEQKLLQENFNLQGFYVKVGTDSKKGAEVRQLQEFVAYAMSNAAFQETLNKIDFAKKSLWQRILDAIMKLLGLDIDETEAELQVKDAQRSLTPKYQTVDNGVDKKMKLDLAAQMAGMKSYSALHVAVRDIVELIKMKNREGAAAGASALSTPLSMDTFYQGVPNFDESWPKEIKELYHQAATNGLILC